jgi:hypothetical protein
LGVLDAAERDRVHTNAVGGPIRREIERQAVQTSLHHRVRHRFDWLLIVGHAFATIEPLIRRDDAVLRRDVDNDAVTLLRECAADHLGAEKRTREPDRNVRVPLVERKILETGKVASGSLDFRVVRGVVDENIDASEPLHHRSQQAFDRVAAGCRRSGV